MKSPQISSLTKKENKLIFGAKMQVFQGMSVLLGKFLLGIEVKKADNLEDKVHMDEETITFEKEFLNELLYKKEGNLLLVYNLAQLSLSLMLFDTEYQSSIEKNIIRKLYPVLVQEFSCYKIKSDHSAMFRQILPSIEFPFITDLIDRINPHKEYGSVRQIVHDVDVLLDSDTEYAKFLIEVIDSHVKKLTIRNGIKHKIHVRDSVKQATGMGNSAICRMLTQEHTKDRSNRVPWKVLLRNNLKLRNSPKKSSSTFSRRSLAKGMYLRGTITSKSTRATIFVDSSGSVSTRELNTIVAEIQRAINEGLIQQAKIYSFDMRVYPPITLTKKELASKVTLEGGGGTSYTCVRREIITHIDPSELIIIFTDLLCKKMKKIPNDVIWIVTESDPRYVNSIELPSHGTLIYM